MAVARLWALVGAAAVTPLLLDLPNIDDTYYGVKARVLMIMGAILAIALTGSRPWTRRAIDRPLALYAAAVVGATLTSVAPLVSLWGDPLRHEGTLVLLAYAAIAAAAARLPPPRATALVQVMVVAAALVAAYGIAQYFGIDPVLRDRSHAGAAWIRAFGTTGGPNWLGGYLVMILAVTLALVLGAARPWTAGGWAAVLGVIHTALLCTLGRAAWISAAVAVGTLFALLALRRIPIAPRRAAGALAILTVVTVAFFLPHGPFARNGLPAPGAVRAKTLALESSVSDIRTVRLRLWRLTLPLVAARPLLGYGPETFRMIFPQIWPEEWQRIYGTRPFIIDKAHNQILDLAMSIGVIGVAGYLWTFGGMWRAGWRRMTSLPPHRALLVAGALAGALGYLLQIETHFSVVSVAPVYWCLVGIGAGLGVPDGQEARGQA